jgi:cysteinyl-tRNA synthetase
MALFDARNAAKLSKDFSRADSIRDELKQRGWLIEDGRSGPKLKKSKP